MGLGKEFIVKELIRGKHEVWLVEKITGRLIEKHGTFRTEDEAERQATKLQGWDRRGGYDGWD